MINRDEILTLLQAGREEMRARFTVTYLGLFGSYARGEALPGSDADILVELAEPTFDHFMDLKFHLETLFGVRVDLVLAGAMKPRLRPYIMKEVVDAEGFPARQPAAACSVISSKPLTGSPTIRRE